MTTLHSRLLTIFAAATLLLFVAGGVSGALTLVHPQQGSHIIVMGENPSEPERFAAAELGRYLEKIGGARLGTYRASQEFPAGQGERVILLGSAAPHSVWLELSQKIEDAYIVRTVGSSLILAGASPRATLYAVYDFLETLGVGFPRPGHSHLLTQRPEPLEREETIPRRTVIKVPPVDRMEIPSFSYRAMLPFPMIRDRSVREIDWVAKNRLNWVHLITNTDLSIWETEEVRDVLMPQIRKRGLHVQGIGHSFFAYIPIEKYGAEHPEYFAVIDGERAVDPKKHARGGLCVSNPEVVKLMAANMSAFLKQNPEIEIIDLWTNDSAAWCACKPCQEMQGLAPGANGRYSTTTRSYLRFVNQVARILAKDHPKVMVNALAYALNTLVDPETKPAANVIVGVAPWGRATYGGSDDYYTPITEPGPVNSTLHPTILGWLELTSNFYLYDYYSNRSEFFPIMDTLRKDYAYYKTIGLDKVSTETFMWDEFNVWVYARLAWDHTTPLKDLVSEFCRIAYRSGAEPMKSFYMELERKKWLWPQHRAELAPLLAEAKSLAEAAFDPTVVAKIERLEMWLEKDPPKTWPHDNPPPPLGE